MSERCDAIVVGGGLAGAALAIELAKSGRHVIVCERESGPHDKVCGEFISLEGARYLDRLGVSLSAMGARAIGSVRLARTGAAVAARLPFSGYSLSRRVLDDALLGLASKAGADVRRATRVKSMKRGPAGWQAAVDGAEPIEAPEAFLATGKHELRGWKRPQGTQGDLIALKMYWTLGPAEAAALEGHVELILFPGGYAGLQPVEGGRANLCLLVRRSVFAGWAHSAQALLGGMMAACPHVRERLHNAEPSLAKPLAISAIPYGYVCRDGGGLWRLGDQAAVIPSFSGDGMSIALHSARLAAAYYLAGSTAADYSRRMHRDVAAQVWRATQVSKILVNPAGQRMVMAVARALPPVPRHVARFTRVANAALARACAPL